MNFKIGDTVTLKSGGPSMTISYATDRGNFECVWFNQTGGVFEPKWHEFKPDMLKLLNAS